MLIVFFFLVSLVVPLKLSVTHWMQPASVAWRIQSEGETEREKKVANKWNENKTHTHPPIHAQTLPLTSELVKRKIE